MDFISFQYSAIRAILVSVLLAMTSVAQAFEIKAGITSFPPFYIINKNQSPSGLLLDIMTKTLEHANLDYRLDNYPTKRLYKNLALGKTHLFLGIKDSPEYDGNVLYSETAISQIQMRIYAIGNTPLPMSKEDINGHKIITIHGYGYGGLVNYFADPKNKIEVTSTSEHRSSFLMLKNKRASYLINYKHPAEAALKTLNIKDLKYTNFYDVKVYFIVSKETPNAQQLLNKLESAYLDLVKKNELNYLENED